jgi:4'-phosphopantetheinyl transferase
MTGTASIERQNADMTLPGTPAGIPTSVTLESIEAVHARLPTGGTGWLSLPEQARLSGMTSPRRRRQFIAGRWLARQCLAAHAGGHWQDYALSSPDDAAPEILAPPPGASPIGLHFSLSHSGDWVACAVSARAVGVDVECNDRPRDFQALNNWVHEAGALQGWAAKTPQQQQDWFYAQWTLKEAWLKQFAPASDRPSMKSVRFESCTHDGNPAAMTGRNALLTLAIYPTTAMSPQLRGEALRQLEWTYWSKVEPSNLIAPR